MSFENQSVEGHWSHQGTVYRDALSRITVDIPDKPANRKWMKQFKERWQKRLEQLELWMISYRIDVE